MEQEVEAMLGEALWFAQEFDREIVHMLYFREKKKSA